MDPEPCRGVVAVQFGHGPGQTVSSGGGEGMRASDEPAHQVVEALCVVGQSAPGMDKASFQPGKRLMLFPEMVAHEGEEPVIQGVEPPLVFPAVGDDQFRRRRGRRRPPVCYKIGDGNVDLVADGADDGNRAAVNGVGHDFFVERPKVLQGTAATGEDQYVAFPPLVGDVEGPRDGRRRFRPLHRDRIDQHRDAGEAPLQYREDIPDGGAAGGGNDPDPVRYYRERFFVGGVEKPLVRQFFLQYLEGPAQGAFARLLQMLDDELEVPPGKIEAGAGMGQDLHAVFRREGQPHPLHPKQGAPNLTVFVLEGEIDMPGARARQVGDLSPDPYGGEIGLNEGTDLPVQAGNGVDIHVS